MSYKLTIRLSDEEHDILKRKAVGDNVGISEYCKNRIFTKNSPESVTDTTEMQKTMETLKTAIAEQAQTMAIINKYCRALYDNDKKMYEQIDGCITKVMDVQDFLVAADDHISDEKYMEYDGGNKFNTVFFRNENRVVDFEVQKGNSGGE